MVYYLAAHRLSSMIAEGSISAEEITRIFLDRIDSLNEMLGVYITVERDSAVKRAAMTDKKKARGDTLPHLAGIPMALKDNLCTENIRTTCGSKMLEDFVPPYSAEVYDRLQRAGCVLVGKTNMDEFGIGSTTENSAFMVTRNPWDLHRVPGGSSGGSAAAVAAGMAAFALGSDTGGSVRQPAALCGVVGMKPTYGRVSRYGLAALASSLDQVGPVTRDVRDCARVLGVICGHDEKDSTSVDTNVPEFETDLEKGIKGMRIGIPAEFFSKDMEKGVKDRVREAINVLERLGAICNEVSLPHTEYAVAAYYIISSAEAGSNLARYDGIRYGKRAETYKDLEDLYIKTRSSGFGIGVKRRIMLGTYALSSDYYDRYYIKALQARTLIREDFDKIFESYDIIAGPTLPVTAFELGDKKDEYMNICRTDLYTVSANLAGLPALSVPCGFVKNLPAGLQLMGKPFSEGTLLRAAYAYEQDAGFYRMRPEIKEVMAREI